MEETQNDLITWDEATTSNSKYIRFETKKRKVIVITNWTLGKGLQKFKDEQGTVTEQERSHFIADVLEEDGVKCEKVLKQTSIRLMKELRAILESKPNNVAVKLSIKALGDGVGRTWDVEEIK